MTLAAAGPEARLPTALEMFDAATPELIESRGLQRRIDRKYLLKDSLLDPLLSHLAQDYRVVESAGIRAATYDTLYFDTQNLQLYHDHLRGVGGRHKVRVRHYVERKLTFLEIKQKKTPSETTKARLARTFGDDHLDETAAAFIAAQSRVNPEWLLPQIWITYRRITLVGETINERITLDWDIKLRTPSRHASLTGLAIAEIKQLHQSNTTRSVQALRHLHLRERSLSKYCYAAALLFPVRNNLLRPSFRAVGRLLT